MHGISWLGFYCNGIWNVCDLDSATPAQEKERKEEFLKAKFELSFFFPVSITKISAFEFTMK